MSNNYVSGKYRFSLSEDKILDLLTGDDLYNDNFVFIRELLQNAIDTVRHRAFIERRNNAGFQPSPIEVSFFKDPEGYHWLRVDDQGMGMNRSIIEAHLLNKGNSYYNSDKFKLEKIAIKANQHEDFVPISRFGIGLLSCFMTCDKIEISTSYFYRREDRENEKNRLSIEGRAGYWVIRSEKLHHIADRMPNEGGWQKGYRNTVGTSIACRIKTSREFQGLNMESEIERFLLAPEIPIVFQGKQLGGDREEMAIKPWCKHSKTPLPAEFLQQCSDILKCEVENIIIEVRPIDLAKMAATSNLIGQLVLVIPQIKMNNAPQHFSTVKHFKLNEEGKNTFLICEKTEVGTNGKEVRIEVKHDISNIIASIHFPSKFYNERSGYPRFIWPRVSHNGIVVYDIEHQLLFRLPSLDEYRLYGAQEGRYLSTGLFCFRDALLPELAVSRNRIKRFTVEIICHVMYATREMNEYKEDKVAPFSYLPELEYSRHGEGVNFSMNKLEKTGMYQNDIGYWHSLPCINSKAEGMITMARALELAKGGCLVFKTFQFQNIFFTEFVKYMVLKNFFVRYISEKEDYYLEGKLSDQLIAIPAELGNFQPMQFIDSVDPAKVVLKNGSFNLQHPLIKWFINTEGIIKRDFSYYGYQFFNELLSDNEPAKKAVNVNVILERLRVILPPDVRPKHELNITEQQL